MNPRRAFGRSRYLLVGLVLAMVTLVLGPAAAGASAGPQWWEPVARPAPDSQVNVTGEPFTGTDAQGRVRGYVDAHVHLMSNEGFGGRLVCGQVFSTAGVADALKDCPEHYPNGVLALFDMITKGGDGRHDPNGWPAFRDWRPMTRPPTSRPTTPGWSGPGGAASGSW